MRPDASQVPEATCAKCRAGIPTRVAVQKTSRRRVKLTEAVVRSLAAASRRSSGIPPSTRTTFEASTSSSTARDVVYHVRMPDPGSRSRYRVVRLGERDEVSCDRARDVPCDLRLRSELTHEPI
jgi:hypothetical protein